LVTTQERRNQIEFLLHRSCGGTHIEIEFKVEKGCDKMHGLVYVIISACFNVFGQYSMKQGMRKFGEVTFDDNILMTIAKMFLMPNVLIGLVFYAISTVFWLIALSKIELSVAYPMLSIGYILLMVLSYFLLNETITTYKVIGTLLIVAGITLISR